jgi:hypothetical protein
MKNIIWKILWILFEYVYLLIITFISLGFLTYVQVFNFIILYFLNRNDLLFFTIGIPLVVMLVKYYPKIFKNK